MRHFFNKKRLASCTLIAVLLITALQLKPETARAQGVPTLTIGDISPTGIANNVSLTGTRLKEFVLDKLASIAAKQILHQMTVSVVNWINSGYKGKPAFLTNPEGFFLDAADQVTGAFLAQNGPLRSLCSPWSADIRIAIALKQSNKTTGGIDPTGYTCTLESIIKNYKGVSVNGHNINGFIGGDFKQGGWPAFIALTTQDQNNPSGAFLRAYSDQMFAVAQKQAFISADLQQSGGFLSWQDCTDAPDSAYNGDLEATGGVIDTASKSTGGSYLSYGKEGNLQQCTNKTPGKVIADSLHDQLGSPVVELELANDINSIISAVVSQLVTQTLQKGLNALGATGSGTSGSGKSYLQQVYTDATTAKNVDASFVTAGSNTQALTDIKSNYTTALGLLNDSKKRYADSRSCFVDVLNNPNLPNGKAASASQIALIDTTVSTKVIPLISQITTHNNTIEGLLSQQSSSAASTATVPGTTNADQLAQSIQTQTTSYLNSFSSLSTSNVDIGALTTTGTQDLQTARAQADIFNADSDSFQSYCERL